MPATSTAVEVWAALAALAAGVRERRISDLLPEVNAVIQSSVGGQAALLAACRDIAAWFVEASAGRFGEGLNEAVTSFTKLESAGFGEGIAWARSPLGLGMGVVGDFELGLTWVERAAEHARQTARLGTLKAALSNKGALLSLAGDQQRAVEVYREALPLDVAGQSGGDVQEVILLNNLSFALIRWARSLDASDGQRVPVASEALDRADQALGLPPSKTIARWRGWGLSNRAGALALLGRRDEAAAQYREALPFCADNLRVQLLTLAGYGDVLAESGRHDEARMLFDEAYAKAPQDLLDATLDFVMEGRVRLEVLAGRSVEALRWSDRRYRRLQEQYGTRVRNALQQSALLASLEQSRQEERALAEVAIRESRQRERESLLQDLHDGLGSQLVGARLRSESGELTQAEMTSLLQDCIGDLYLVVDSLNSEEGHLADALRFMRHRYESRMVAHATALLWTISLDDAPPMPAPRMIQALRVVQEAISNALKHARARTVRIGARFGDGDLIVISIEDDGRGMVEPLKAGLGLQSMHNRARGLGGRLAITSARPGTRINLSFPARAPA